MIPASVSSSQTHASPVPPQAEKELPAALTKLVTSFEVLFDGFTPEQPRRSFHERLNALLRETEAAFNALEPGQAAQFTVLFRDRLHPYFLQANAMARAFHKPLGYAGDYEVMNMAYRNQPEGDSPLGKALHQWFNTTLGATAVRTRRRWILEQMQIHGRDWKGTYKICSVAAGSAYELGDLIHESFLVERCELTCVDQDRSALTFASEQLNEAMQHAERSCPTAFVHDSVHNMVGAGATAARRFTPQSFIYSLGLYDYLPEKVGRLLTRYLYNQLEPGGRLIVGNYAQQTDTRFTIEMVMDWQLLYRSEAQLMALAADLPIGATCRYTAECTGMQLFLIVDKPR